MARGFRRRRGRYVARLSASERDVLVTLMDQVRDLLGGTPEDGDAFTELVTGAGLQAAPVEDPLEDPLEDTLDGPDADPALRRLLPDAHHDDPLAAAEFRQLSESALRRRKTANLTAAIAALAAGEQDGVDLDGEQAGAVLVALTDVRLVLGERLGLRNEEDAQELETQALAGLEPHRAGLVLAYDFLTWLQESLARALLP